MEDITRPVYCRGVKTNLLVPMREDIPRILRWINDYEVTQFLATSIPFFEENEEAWLKYLAGNRLSDQVFIIGTADCTPIGVIGLHRINWVSRHATLGVFIGEKAYWEKKHGTEAMMLLLHYAFERNNLQRVGLEVHDFNERAIRCYTRCGFKEEGRREKYKFRGGEFSDTLLMRTFREEWFAKWQEFQKKQAES